MLSSPSIVILLVRADCPLNESPEVATTPSAGVRSRVTRGVVKEKSKKLRRLIGKSAIFALSIIVLLSVFPSVNKLELAVISIISLALLGGKVTSKSEVVPITMDKLLFCVLKPVAEILTS